MSQMDCQTFNLKGWFAFVSIQPGPLQIMLMCSYSALVITFQAELFKDTQTAPIFQMFYPIRIISDML